MVVTRFNPSANGNLHLGHLFTMLVNKEFAKSRGGEFHVRFDDTSTICVALGDRMERIIRGQIMDISWLGMFDEVASWTKQSNLRQDVDKKLQEFGFSPVPETEEGKHYLPLVVGFGTDWLAYPYMPQQTAERVIMDNILGVTHVIRGDDFLSEYSLYRYFCQLFRFPAPELIFLPRLRSKHGDISKTKGGYKISDMRANGYTPEQIIDLLAKACLIYPSNGWELYNIKSNPKIDL